MEESGGRSLSLVKNEEVVDFPGTYVKKEYVNVNGVKMLRDVWDYMSHDREEEHGFDDNANRVHKKLSNFTGDEDPKILKKAYQMELRNFIEEFKNQDMDPQPFIDELDQLEEGDVTQVNFDLDKRFKVNPTEPQKAYDAFIDDYLPFHFSNGMELNIMDEDYDPNYTVWVLNDVNGKQIDMGEKVDDLVDVLQSMTHIPIEQDVANFDENFADGKKKGKSRPGRVKRAGASCKGSVTSLRKKAKNSSGEKSKMYHWCANMKSGRKKK